MRRKSDMFRDFTDRDVPSFLPGEGEQEATTAAAQTRERLAKVEDQLRSQFTSIAAYAQISQQAVDTARAEARADLDREKATVVSLLERLRREAVGDSPNSPAPIGSTTTSGPAMTASPLDVSALARIALLEDNFERLDFQVAQLLKSQQELATSIAFVFEHQMRNAGWLTNCGEAGS